MVGRRAVGDGERDAGREDRGVPARLWYGLVEPSPSTSPLLPVVPLTSAPEGGTPGGGGGGTGGLTIPGIADNNDPRWNLRFKALSRD